ncbi:hypothetical protein OO012_02125 [Rhodobacteraceae bacterium KMM 6894]|nr:hypothetical protein [Rhodobacteraceae bacterium KMM 6894]
MRSFARAVKSTALVLLSVLIALLIFLAIDVAYTLWTAPDPALDPYDRRANGWYQLRPDFVGTETFGSETYGVYTDANGFRTAAPVGDTPDQGPARTLFLGDSFTYGINGPWSDTFVGMYAATASGPVKNAGVASYSPTAYLLHYRAALAKDLLAPEHRVIIGVDISDVQDEAAKWTEIDGTPARYSALRDSGLTRWLDRTFPHGLTLWGMVEDGLKALKSPGAVKGSGQTDAVAVAMAGIPRSAFTFQNWETLDAQEYAPLGVAGGLERIESKLAELTALAHDNGGEVWLLAYPWPAQLVHDSAQLDWPSHLRGVCERIKCAGVIDAFPAFQQARDSDPDWYATLFLNKDVHYSKAGNALVYTTVLDAIGP